MEWRNHPAELIIEKNKNDEEKRLHAAEPSASPDSYRDFGSFVAMTKEQEA
jgi:hypothetical protein